MNSFIVSIITHGYSLKVVDGGWQTVMNPLKGGLLSSINQLKQYGSTIQETARRAAY